MNYRLLYFASLRDRTGCASESLSTDAADLRTLYAEIASRHGLALAAERLRVAVNGEFAQWDTPLRDNDEVVFLPPVSGG